MLIYFERCEVALLFTCNLYSGQLLAFSTSILCFYYYFFSLLWILLCLMKRRKIKFDFKTCIDCLFSAVLCLSVFMLRPSNAVASCLMRGRRRPKDSILLNHKNVSFFELLVSRSINFIVFDQFIFVVGVYFFLNL